MMMAMIDGIRNKIEPTILEDNIYELSAEELAKYPKTPATLGDSIDALEADHDFLLRGDVFTPDVIEAWIDYKMENEVLALDLRPHPYEFMLYYDI